MKTLVLSLEAGAALSVRRFESHERAGAPFSVTVLVRSEDASVDIDAIVGGRASLHVADEQTTRARGWRGMVARMEQVAIEPRGLSTYELSIVPDLWLLGKRTNHRIFQHLGVRKIVSEILGEWGIASTWDADDGRHPPFEYRVQYGESDLAFVSRLLEESGLTMLFPVAADGHVGARVHLSDRPGHAEPRLLPLRWIEQPGPLREEPDVAFAVSWAREVRPGAQFVRDHDFMKPTYALGAASTAAAGVEARLEQHHYRPGAFLVESDEGAGHDEDYGERVAERGKGADRAGHRVLSCEATTMDLGPGVVFGLLGHPHPDLGVERRFLVTELACAGGEAGEPWVTRLRSVPAEIPYHPPRATPRPKVHGVQSATVVGPGEIHTDASGRVRVHFPWDREGKRDDASCWIRPAQGWSGTGYGAFALPRVGQEVLVSFLEGDPDRPVIVGRLHNQTSVVPYTLPERKTESGYRSASSPGGGGKNEIIVEDASSKELLSHHAERDQRVLVKHDDTSTIGNDRLLQVAENHRDETVGDRVQHTEGSRFEDTVLSFTESTAGNARRQVGGDDDHYLEGSRLAYFDKDLDAITDKVRREELRSHEDLTVKRGSSAKVGGESIGASSLQVSAGKIAIHADGDMHVMGGTIVIEGMSATAKSGGSFVNCNAGGVAIKGPIVKINEGGAAGSLAKAGPAEAELPTAPSPASPLDVANSRLEIVRVRPEGDVPVVVGERVVLKAVVVSGQVRVDAKDGDVTWAVAGEPIAAYHFDNFLGEVIPLDGGALKQAAIEFCWGRDGSFDVMVDGAFRGTRAVPASMKIYVCSPTPEASCGGKSDTVDVRPEPAPLSGTWVRFGSKRFVPPQPNAPAPGIEFLYSASAKMPRKIDGEITGVQLIKMRVRQKIVGGKWESMLVQKGRYSTTEFDLGWVADETVPYQFQSPLPAGRIAKWTMPTGENVSDSPGAECADNYEQSEFHIAAKTYFMYRPVGPENIWVALGCMEWSATGAAVRTGVTPPQWTCTVHRSTQGKFQRSHNLPEWESNIRRRKWV